MSRLSIIKELWDFLKFRKRFWLAPILVVLLLLGMLIMFVQCPVVAPFVYTLF